MKTVNYRTHFKNQKYILMWVFLHNFFSFISQNFSLLLQSMCSTKNNKNIFRCDHLLQCNKILLKNLKKRSVKFSLEPVFGQKSKNHFNSEFGSNTKSYVLMLDIV